MYRIETCNSYLKNNTCSSDRSLNVKCLRLICTSHYKKGRVTLNRIVLILEHYELKMENAIVENVIHFSDVIKKSNNIVF